MKVNEENDSGGVAVSSPRPAPESSREWIEGRYGPITVVRRSVMYDGGFAALVIVFVAAVPVMNGIAIGAGATEMQAVNSLKADLSGEIQNMIAAASPL